jgi:BirA family biotin operon repressor/biotin-[acetyl-CoA-carboxylase] ligase
VEGPGAISPTKWSVTVVDETGSTNADLLAAGREGAPHGTVLVARHQTAGRGRLDRRWDAPPGANLLMSVLFREGTERPHRLGQRVGLAVVDAAWDLAGARATLKWPNDVLLDGRKLAGVLAESGGVAGRLDFVVVGVGVNVGWAPEGAARLAGPGGAGPSVDALRDAVLAHLAVADIDLEGRYRGALSTLGSLVRVELPAGELVGTAVDVDADGALVVVDGLGARTRVSVGDVVHLRPAAGTG